MARLIGTGFAALALGALASLPAQAEGFPPYFGFSGYYGGPAPYYTHDTDVHVTTGGAAAYPIATFTAGGPFWGYKTNYRQAIGPRHQRRVRYIRVKG